jgi:benzoyl-CoA reductase/2-hydroxyglutaryl-CoA dehydratase subunit BcrC/BadD/HgdB
MTNTCPFFRLSDMIVAETTCDGKKKMFELLDQYKPLHVMHLPPGAGRPSSRQMWMEEVRLFQSVLENFCGVTITREMIREAIGLYNVERRTMRALHELNKAVPAPLGGLDTLKALLLLFFNADKEYGVELLKQLISEVESSPGAFSPFLESTPRILLTGCPVSLGSEKVVVIAEECGASVVCFEMCSGSRGFDLVDEDIAKDPIEAMVDRHLSVPCACMSPNPGRPRLIGELIKEYRIDGIIDLTWQACHTFAIEDAVLQQHNQSDWKLPFLHIETDYSSADVEQLHTRIAAFVEIMRDHKK